MSRQTRLTASLPSSARSQGKLDGIKFRQQAITTLKGVSFRYEGGERQILDGVDAKLCLNSRVAILGENGAGKTTMLKLLIGDLQLPAELAAVRAETSAETLQGDAADAEAKKIAKAKARMVQRIVKRGQVPDGVWRHHNLRTAYIAQHSMHHLEENLQDTPFQYIQKR